MEKYLSRLLELNHRVIIPDLGAFIIRQQDPKELVFNDLLAFDDGVLTEQLIQDEKLSKTEAQSRIKQFVEKVKKILQKGDEYPLENIGTLKMDASSRIKIVVSNHRVQATCCTTSSPTIPVRLPALRKVPRSLF